MAGTSPSSARRGCGSGNSLDAPAFQVYVRSTDEETWGDEDGSGQVSGMSCLIKLLGGSDGLSDGAIFSSHYVNGCDAEETSFS